MAISVDNISRIVALAYPAVTSVPGVAALMISKELPSKISAVKRKHDLFKNIEIKELTNRYEISIKLSLIEDINILDVAKEVQIRASYELEQKLKIDKPFFINVYVNAIIQN